jgi:hypothetical protein
LINSYETVPIIQDLTNLLVTVELPDSNITEQFRITKDGITAGHEVQLKNVWGHVNFVARGEGQALAQLGRNLVPGFHHRGQFKAFVLWPGARARSWLSYSGI